MMRSTAFPGDTPVPFKCLLMLTALATSAWAATDKLQTWADRDHFPEAYSILSSDRVMFPDNVSDWPLKINSTHQLFVDDFLISKIENLTRQFHQPTKHPANPLMKGWEVAVLYDKDQGRFRMWNGSQYFTSADGVHWEAPRLGPEGNRIIFKEGGGIHGLMYNPDIPEPEGRYKAVLTRRQRDKVNESIAFYLYHSRDGLNWDLRPQEPILQQTPNLMLPCEFRPTGAGNPADFQWANPDHIQAIGAGDTTTFRYDRVLKRYIYDGKFKFHMPGETFKRLGIIVEPEKPLLRLRTFSESEDLIHWSPPRMMFYPDRLDPPDRQIYSHVGFVYESMWLGIIRAMRLQVTGWKQVDLQLSYSRDGRHWSRPDQRQPFIPLGDAESWEADYSAAPLTEPVLLGEELYFYYFGSRHFTRDQIPVSSFQPYVGLAKLRRDGFASLNADKTPGQVATRPLTFTGKHLFVNADVGNGGWIKAAVWTRDSQPIAGYALADAAPLTKNTTKGRLAWKSKAKLNHPGDDHFRIVFQLKNAKLYSFWIE